MSRTEEDKGYLNILIYPICVVQFQIKIAQCTQNIHAYTKICVASLFCCGVFPLFFVKNDFLHFFANIS